MLVENDKQAIPIGLNAFVKIGDSLSIDCYMVMGAFRYGLSQASELLGYEKTYLSQVVFKQQKKLKDLQSKGFTGCLLTVKVSRSRPKTLSFDDFCILVEHEAIEVKNPKAIALLTSSFREVLLGRTQVAFGLAEDDLQVRQAAFWKSFQEREAIWSEDRADIEMLILPGDEEIDLVSYFPEIARFDNDSILKYYDVA
jgi:hypothetical protein